MYRGLQLSDGAHPYREIKRRRLASYEGICLHAAGCSEREIQTILAYQAGLTQTAIARKIGVSYGRVGRLLDQAADRCAAYRRRLRPDFSGV